MSDPMTQSHPIIQIYDVILLICSHLERQQLTRLLVVSRTFFNYASPLIWKRLEHVWPLLRLNRLGFEGDFGSCYDVEELRNQIDLSRFNTYSPLVKCLDIQLACKQDSPNWAVLLSVFKQRPLFPNLRQLKLEHTSSERVDEKSIIACVTGLLSPSLSEIRLPRCHNYMWLEPEDASHLTKTITNKSEDLEILHLFVQHPSQFSYTDSEIFTSISQLCRLQVLKCTGAVLDPTVLQLLGDIPLLESLTVEVLALFGPYTPKGTITLDSLTLSNNSFPMLKHLNLQCVSSSVVSQLWSALPLVQGLISVEVAFSSDSELSNLNSIIWDICTYSPRSQYLSLEYFMINDGIIPLDVANQLQRLPLRRLRLGSALLLYPTADGFTRMTSYWPDMEYLEIPQCQIRLNELVLVAKHLPKLRFLGINFGWKDEECRKDWLNSGDPLPVTPSPSAMCIGSSFLFRQEFPEHEFETGGLGRFLDVVARNLCALWPRGVRCELVDLFDIVGRGGEEDSKYAKLLQDKINDIQGPMDTESASWEGYVPVWMYD